MRKILVLSAFLLAAGCSSSAPAIMENSQNQAVASPTLSDCKDLLNVNNLEQITGRDDWELKVNRNDSNSASCYYQTSSDISQSHLLITVNITVTPNQPEHNMTVGQIFNTQKTAFQGVDVSGIGSQAFQGNIIGIPHLAYISSNKKYFVLPVVNYISYSPEQKATEDKQKDLEIATALAKILDNNLSKY